MSRSPPLPLVLAPWCTRRRRSLRAPRSSPLPTPCSLAHVSPPLLRARDRRPCPSSWHPGARVAAALSERRDRRYCPFCSTRGRRRRALCARRDLYRTCSCLHASPLPPCGGHWSSTPGACVLAAAAAWARQAQPQCVSFDGPDMPRPRATNYRSLLPGHGANVPVYRHSLCCRGLGGPRTWLGHVRAWPSLYPTPDWISP